MKEERVLIPRYEIIFQDYFKSAWRLFTVLLIYVVSLCGSNMSAQETSLKIYNTRTKKEVLVDNNNRILAVTKDGTRYRGKVQILDNSRISINGQVLELSNIKKIRRNTLLLNILKYTVITVGVAYIITGLVVSSGSLAPLITSSMGGLVITGGFLLPSLSRSKHSYYTYEIVELKT